MDAFSLIFGLVIGLFAATLVVVYAHDRSFRRDPEIWIDIIQRHLDVKRLRGRK